MLDFYVYVHCASQYLFAYYKFVLLLYIFALVKTDNLGTQSRPLVCCRGGDWVTG